MKLKETLILPVALCNSSVLTITAPELSAADKQYLSGYEKVRAALAADDLDGAKKAPADLGRDGTAIEMTNFVCAIFLAGLMAGCAASDPPPFPPNSSADPQVHGSSNLARLALRDQTSEEIERALNATKKNVKSTETMQHDMHNMSGVKHGEMQHTGEMKTGATIYTCPMHPQVQLDKPGKCPICGMTLVKRKEAK
jgi:Heavy metal binding domain